MAACAHSALVDKWPITSIEDDGSTWPAISKLHTGSAMPKMHTRVVHLFALAGQTPSLVAGHSSSLPGLPPPWAESRSHFSFTLKLLASISILAQQLPPMVSTAPLAFGYWVWTIRAHKALSVPKPLQVLQAKGQFVTTSSRWAIV